MRIGIIAHSLPDALRLEAELREIPGCELFVLMCRAPRESLFQNSIKHVARFLVKAFRARSISAILRRRVRFFTEPLDSPASVSRLQLMALDIGLHASGLIYRQGTIDAFRLGILNAHIGILPQYRGRNVMEWALIEGGSVGISVFFVDTGIDTGERIVVSEEVEISHCKSVAQAKSYLFNLDGLYFRKAIEALQRQDFRYGLNDGSGLRYYVMSRLFQGVVEDVLKG